MSGDKGRKGRVVRSKVSTKEPETRKDGDTSKVCTDEHGDRAEDSLATLNC